MPQRSEYTRVFQGQGRAPYNFSLAKMKFEQMPRAAATAQPSTRHSLVAQSLSRKDLNGRMMGRTLRDYNSHSLVGNGMAGY
jgi:hypothetical protein